jgi:hypothetical protein
MPTGHPQIRQCEQRHHLRRILGQATEAHFHITKLAFDHSERVLDLRPYLRLGFFDFALGFVQSAALAQFLVNAAPGRDLPDDLATVMPWTLLDPGVTGIGTHHVLFAVQQSVDLRNVRNIGAVTTTLCTSPDSSSTPAWAFAPK